MRAKWLFLLSLLLISYVDVYAEEIYLKNGDKITGEIIKENQDGISVKSEVLGTVSIHRNFIKRIASSDEKSDIVSDKKLGEVIWQREVSAGYNYTSGNTRNSQLSTGFLINRNRYHIDEITLKGNTYYSSADRRMDAQRWYAMTRYAFSFGKTRMWYNFYRTEFGHDRFANIDYRIVPVAGIGYWLYDLPEIKLMAEAGVGYEHTDFRDETEDREEIILAPRAFFEKSLFDNSKIAGDLYYYPLVDDFSQYRLRAETNLTIAMNKRLSICLSLVDDYNSDPPKDTKKNDLRVISSVVYSF